MPSGSWSMISGSCFNIIDGSTTTIVAAFFNLTQYHRKRSHNILQHISGKGMNISEKDAAQFRRGARHAQGEVAISGHRFDSFSGQRSGNTVKWCALLVWPKYLCLFTLFRHIDGHDYMWALSEILESANGVIFIMVERFLPI